MAAPAPPVPEDSAPRPPARRRIATIAEMHAAIRRLREDLAHDPVALGAAMAELELEPPPVCAELRALDPLGPDYAARAFALMAELRGAHGFSARRDERIGHSLADRDLWTGLSPWDHRSPAFLAEMFECYAAMLREIGAPPGARVLEYGPGTGQFLLFLARIGYQCHAVDVEPEYLRVIRAQARAMRLPVRLERGLFGEGFAGESFDAIIFFEAFHHARDFMGLLRHLRGRLNPGGRLILCGEPMVPDGMVDGPVPYPWGPRLDGMSIEAIQRGWTELGYQAGFLLTALQRAGWAPRLVAHPTTFRAHMIVSTVAEDAADAA
ncbi:class I SAM-dependent methyltransferase [Rubritepida flocculans]|uniref:class I SAM-dependent methyltransferase n=1 Tax=Rubritepida flocculans TaxID=182403 RepID=UPI0003FA67B7|nr:class I SAM-dependent methyltransferase [Rubritepida flocculans]